MGSRPWWASIPRRHGRCGGPRIQSATLLLPPPPPPPYRIVRRCGKCILVVPRGRRRQSGNRWCRTRPTTGRRRDTRSGVGCWGHRLLNTGTVLVGGIEGVTTVRRRPRRRRREEPLGVTTYLTRHRHHHPLVRLRRRMPPLFAKTTRTIWKKRTKPPLPLLLLLPTFSVMAAAWRGTLVLLPLPRRPHGRHERNTTRIPPRGQQTPPSRRTRRRVVYGSVL